MATTREIYAALIKGPSIYNVAGLRRDLEALKANLKLLSGQTKKRKMRAVIERWYKRTKKVLDELEA